MKKTTRKYLSFVLATVMVFLLVSTSTTALDVTDNSSADFTENSTPPQDVVIPNPDYVADDSQSKVIEITALRDENVKHFQLPDGTMQAVAFPTAIHEKDAEGKWQPIDSSVSLKSIRGVDVYTTKNGTTRFASSVTNNSPLFTISENGYVIEVSLENFLSSNLVHTTDAARRVVVSSAEPVKTAEWQSVEDAISSVSINSVVRYESVYPYTDIEYTVTKDAVKENIVIKSVEGTTVYKFKYQLTGLIAALNDNGSISLLDKETKKLEYEIPSPYMYDANGEISRDVHYTLSETAKGTYIITVTADEEWLSAEARAYPVVIDPSISSSRVVWDTFVNSADPDQTYGDWGVWVGPYYTGLARNNMPTLPSGAVVTSGKLNVYYYFLSGVTGSRVIGAYKMTKSWSEMNDSYNSLKNRYGDSLGISTTLLSTATAFASSGITSSNPRKITFDVTSAVSSWYSGDSNYGIALKHYSGTPQATDGTNTGTIIKNFETYSDYRMYYTIAYTIPNGVYAIEKADTNVYVKNNTLDELAWVFQEPFASSPINESDRDYMFKITYRPSTDDYVIRSMSNNEIIIYPSVYNNAPVAGRVTVYGAPATDSNISTAYTWKMTTTSDGYDYIWYKENGTTYYMRSTSNEGSGPILSFTTNQYNVGTKWSFHRYTGDPIDGIGRLNFKYDLILGEAYEHKAYMYSSTIGRNGPVTYSSGDINIFTVNSSTGLVAAYGPGSANIWVSYYGSPRAWGRTATVGGMCFFRNGSNYITPTGSTMGTSLKLNLFNGNDVQNWEFVYQGEGYYLIKNRNNGYYITSPSGNIRGAVITQETLSSAILDQQLWKIMSRNANGTYRIQSKVRVLDGSNLFLGLSGTNVVQTDPTNSVDWRLPYVNSSTIGLEGQQMSNWCWATSSRMFTNHYYAVPTTRTQVTAVAAVMGSVVDWGGTHTDAIKAVGHYRSNNINSNILNLIGDYQKIFEENILLKFIDDGNVVYIARGWYSASNVRNGGHAYLVYGYTKEIINGNLEIRYLIRDPYPTVEPIPWDTPTITTGKTHLWSYDTICNGRKTGEDNGIWDRYVVVTTDYSSETVSPVYN